MPDPHHGSVEIEQTLQLARDAIERDIAKYRVWSFVAIVAVTGALRVAGVGDSWIPSLTFVAALGYALVVRAYLHRVGNPPALAVVTLLADIAIGVGVFQMGIMIGLMTFGLKHVDAGRSVILAKAPANRA